MGEPKAYNRLTLYKRVMSYDRYNNPEDYSLTNAQTREDLKSQFRFNFQFIPIDGESLAQWSKRVENVVRQLESYSISKHIEGKKGAWYTHWSSSSCFMCDQATACRFYILSLLGLTKLGALEGFEWKSASGNQWIIIRSKSAA